MNVHMESLPASTYEPIVPLQLRGSRTPLFLVHPADGATACFFHLAQHFAGDRPIFALRPRGLADAEPPFATFDDMVFDYADAILHRQARGPYALAGYAYGGPVAFEIAKVLESRGRHVTFCSSIDMPPRLLHIPGKPNNSSVEQALWSLAKGHVPSGMVESVTVFYTQPPAGIDPEWLLSQLRQWDDHSRRSNSYIPVASERDALFHPEHVETFHAVLAAQLAYALGDSPLE